MTFQSGDIVVPIGNTALFEAQQKSLEPKASFPDGWPKAGVNYLVTEVRAPSANGGSGLVLHSMRAICPLTSIDVGWDDRCFLKVAVHGK